MPSEKHNFRFTLNNGGTLEKTGFLEVLTRDGNLSRCRIIMSRLPRGFDPDAIAEITLLEDAAGNQANLVAEELAPQGPVDRGSLTLRASFRGFEPPEKRSWMATLLWIGVLGTTLSHALRFCTG